MVSSSPSPAGPTYCPKSTDFFDSPATETAMQLIKDSAEACRKLRRLKKEHKPAIATAQRDMAKYKQVMADYDNKMQQARADFAAAPEFPSFDNMELWADWRAKFNEARDYHDHFHQNLVVFKSEIQEARDACTNVARAQDAFMVAQGNMDPIDASTWDDSDDGEDHIESLLDIASTKTPELVANAHGPVQPARNIQQPVQPSTKVQHAAEPAAKVQKPTQPQAVEHNNQDNLPVTFDDPDVDTRFNAHRILTLSLEIAYTKHDSHRIAYRKRLEAYIESHAHSHPGLSQNDHANAFGPIWQAECMALNAKINEAEIALDGFEKGLWDAGLPIMTKWDWPTEREHEEKIAEEDYAAIYWEKKDGLDQKIEKWMECRFNWATTPGDGMEGSEVWRDDEADTLVDAEQEDVATDDDVAPAKASRKRKAIEAADFNASKKRTRRPTADRKAKCDATVEEDFIPLEQSDTKRKRKIPTGARGSKKEAAAPPTPQDPPRFIKNKNQRAPPRPGKRPFPPPFSSSSSADAKTPRRKRRVCFPHNVVTIDVSGPAPPQRSLKNGDVVRDDDGLAYHGAPLRRGMVRRYCRRVRGGYL
ncbi:hypothetical protein DE146DRAFT_793209 [Phaeosphaeria sp. MPI-PUGE-AT-0046c]|nr:hypothetical protein DE146DRAFT_793209 [Phaeosphaeria sp. MPI-PUGE-AT-0046c]